MLALIINIILLVIFTEAITELVVKSEIFSSIREFFFKSEFKVFNFIHKILDCGYCFSVWAALFTIALTYLSNTYVNTFILIIIIHRLSNVFHNLVDKLQGNL